MLASYKKSLHAAFMVVFYLAIGLHAYAQSGKFGISLVAPSWIRPAPSFRMQPSKFTIRSATLSDRPTTDSSGKFSFPNVPFNPYHLSVTAAGFAPYTQDVEVRSTVPLDVKINLQVAGSSESVTVEASELIYWRTIRPFTPTWIEDLFDKLPLESQSSSLSSLVTLASPGIAADSNGLFHGLGDHAENSFSVDGQPITDQQSKVFSNQIPLDSVESMEVISGAPPAEYGDKTSVVINVTTRSGQGVTTPTAA